MDVQRIRAELAKLEPDIPWAHHFDLCGVETITAHDNEQFYRKAGSAKLLSQLALLHYATYQKKPLSSARILDVASAEGGFSVEFAKAGAQEVVGIEGRRLYVDRAEFVSRVLGLENVRFLLGDVRKIDVAALGTFDFTICSGILHHLGKDDFFPFLKSMAALTKGAMFLFTHLSGAGSIERFRLRDPVRAADEFEGWQFREHEDDASPLQRERQVRASLDNTFSFWATEESLIAALGKAGFGMIAKIFEPHVVREHWDKNVRSIFIARND